MSVWTHVAGIIRLDGYYDYMDIQNWLSRPARFEDETYRVWEKCTLPMGSEGSLVWELHGTGRDLSLCNSYICFHGDLRDFDVDDGAKIVTWWNDIFDRKLKVSLLPGMQSVETKLIFRNAVLQYYCEKDNVVHTLWKNHD